MPKRRPTAQDRAYLVYLAMTGAPDPQAIEELAARLKVLWWHWRLSDGRRSVPHER